MTRVLLLACLLLIGAVGWLLWSKSESDAARDAALSELSDTRRALADAQSALATERAAAERMAGIAAQYEQERINAQDMADRVIADLRAGNERLHVRWQACAATSDVSAAATASGQLDAGADDRAASAAAIVRAAAECDAQVKGLQAVIRADRR